MHYESMMYCAHANESPQEKCTCPANCGCRESMCRESPATQTSSGSTSITVHSGILGYIHRNGSCLATFSSCRFWGHIDLRPGNHAQPDLEVVRIDNLRLKEDTVRSIVAGRLPMQLFHGVQLVFAFTEPVSFTVNMVWGDLLLYETGQPALRSFMAVPDAFEGLPPPALVRRVLARLKQL